MACHGQASEVQPTLHLNGVSPMLELTAYLRANGFKTSSYPAAAIEFMRAWTERIYGIPPEQVVGSSGKAQFEMRDGKPVLMLCPNWASSTMVRASRSGSTCTSADGRFSRSQFRWRPADAAMDRGRQWRSFHGHRPSYDAVREWAYDRQSSIGRLDKALDAAQAQGWTVVDMKNDWGVIFPFDKK